MNFISIVIIVGLENLDQLVLNHNQLTEINAKWFKGLENLHDLKLCNNEISHIDDAAFEGLEGKIA
jgi:Leucine-rich repeat (LRR) protein